MWFLTRREISMHHIYTETTETSFNYQERWNMSKQLKQLEIDFCMTAQVPVKQVKAMAVVTMAVLTVIQTTFCTMLTIFEVSPQVQVWDHGLLLSISNKPSVRQEHPGVCDGPDSYDGTSYPLTENQTQPSAQATGRIAYLPCSGYYTMPLNLVALYMTLAAPASGFLYFESGMWWRICTIRTTRMLHSSQHLRCSRIPNT